MTKLWPQSKIRELLAQAAANGEARAQLDSRDNAERFRYSIYAFRKSHGIGYDVSVTLDDNTVVVTKKTTPSVVLLSETLSEAADVL